MHGGPKAILVLKRGEDMMPDFSGPGYISAKKKMVHGGCPKDDCPGGDACPHGDKEDDAYASEPMTTDDTYEESNGSDTDPPMDDMDIDAKLKQMKQMANDMRKMADELTRVAESQQGPETEPEDAIGGDSLKEESESSYRSKKFPLSGSREETKELKKAERERKRTKRDIEKRDRKIYRRMKKVGELE